MKNININKKERVEVMALFGYEMTPCEPLSFKRRGEVEDTEVSELLGTRVKFENGSAHHFFDILANRTRYVLEFDSRNLFWHLTLA